MCIKIHCINLTCSQKKKRTTNTNWLCFAFPLFLYKISYYIFTKMHITIKTNSKIISRKRKGNKKKLLAQKAMKIYLSVKEIIIYPNHHPPYTFYLPTSCSFAYKLSVYICTFVVCCCCCSVYSVLKANQYTHRESAMRTRTEMNGINVIYIRIYTVIYIFM